MDRKSLTITLGIAVAVVLVAATLMNVWSNGRHEAQSISDIADISTVPTGEDHFQGDETGQGIDEYRKTTVQIAYESAENYAEFAKEILPNAEDGDADSQYFLSQVLATCDRALKNAVHSEDGEVMSAEEVRLRFNLAGLPDPVVERAVETHVRCRDFHDVREEYGAEWDWLEQAAAGGQATAKAVFGMTLMVPGNPNKKLDFELGKALLSEATRTRDPVALWLLGSAMEIWHKPFGERSKIESSAYKILACQYGYDCSSDAEWVTEMCWRKMWSCPSGSTGVDFIKERLGADAGRAVSMADDIRDKMDQGQWEALGLDSGLTENS